MISCDVNQVRFFDFLLSLDLVKSQSATSFFVARGSFVISSVIAITIFSQYHPLSPCICFSSKKEKKSITHYRTLGRLFLLGLLVISSVIAITIFSHYHPLSPCICCSSKKEKNPPLIIELLAIYSFSAFIALNCDSQ